MPINAGELNTQITLQRKKITRDSFGAETVKWLTVAEPMAKKLYQPPVERYAAAQFTSKSVVTFLIRWSNLVKGLTAEWRLIHDGRVYDVIGQSEFGRREGIMIDTVVNNETQLDNA